MKESKFIEQNKDEWVGFEKLLDSDSKDPDKLSDFFIKITDDLSYARTFYNNRSIRVYLNNLCQQLFYKVYRAPKKRKGEGIKNFWLVELPQVAHESKREILASLFIFLLAVAIGVVSSINDPQFAKVILGDEYIAMTVENIESGDPMAVYKKMNEMDMFLGITLNNLLVSVKTFLLGILWAAGSVIILLYNGIMVGAFQYFFIERGLFQESFLTIWMHGTFEMSAIVIAGASGLVLGRGVIDPGSYTRLQSFQLAAKKAAKLFLGIVPIIIGAALIESFLTRYTEVPDSIRLVVILLSLIFMFFQFWWLPLKVSKSNTKAQRKEKLQASPNFTVSYEGVIKSAGDVLRDTFLLYRKFGTSILRVNLLAAICYMPIVLLIVYPELSKNVYTYGFEYFDWIFELTNHFFDYNTYPYLIPINSVFFSIHSYFILMYLVKDVFPKLKLERKVIIIYLIYSVILNALIYSIDLFSPGIQVIASLVASPLIAFFLFMILFRQETNFNDLLKSSQNYLKGNYGFLIGLSFLALLISVALFLFLNSPLPVFYMEFVNWNLTLDFDQMELLAVTLNGFFSMFSILIAIPIFLFSVAMCYFSFKEIHLAEGLKTKIQAFGK